MQNPDVPDFFIDSNLVVWYARNQEAMVEHLFKSEFREGRFLVTLECDGVMLKKLAKLVGRLPNRRQGAEQKKMLVEETRSRLSLMYNFHEMYDKPITITAICDKLGELDPSNQLRGAIKTILKENKFHERRQFRGGPREWVKVARYR